MTHRVMLIIDRTELSPLIHALQRRGYAPIGPTLREEAIVYDAIRGANELPEGWGDVQEAGTYRLRRRDDRAVFGYSSAAQSWKRFLLPPRRCLFRARRDGSRIELVDQPDEPPRLALIGVRPCELRALEVLDRVLGAEGQRDSYYQRARAQALIIVVNCGEPAATCFCTSLSGDPRAPGGFDLAFTEIVDNEQHVFAVEVGTAIGEALLQEVPHRVAQAADVAASEAVLARSRARMGRKLTTAGLKQALERNADSPLWGDVAERCLACGNCTSVCPTCFCFHVQDATDLDGTTAERWQTWDSCFSREFTYIHGGPVRDSIRSRYRQWLMHKLARWQDQFGELGCVGCGRCITWCPVGIDITAEATAIGQLCPASEDGPGLPTDGAAAERAKKVAWDEVVARMRQSNGNQDP